MIDWNRAFLLLAQVAVVIVLGVCVAAGHNSAVTDGLLAVSGSIAGVGLFQVFKKKDTTAERD